MKRNRIAKGFKVALLVVVASVVFGFVVKSLWNWLMPAIFGLHLITFWQGLGLFLLGKVLFGGFHGRHGGGGHWRGRMRARWESMTPEERERFRQGMKGCCSPFASSAIPRQQAVEENLR